MVTLTPKSGDPGTAALGRDYTRPETFTIAAGDTTAEADVTIKDDEVNERDETINLTADNPEWKTVTPVTSPYTIGNLTNGVRYHVRVTGEMGQFRGGWVSASGTPGPGGI